MAKPIEPTPVLKGDDAYHSSRYPTTASRFLNLTRLLGDESATVSLTASIAATILP